MAIFASSGPWALIQARSIAQRASGDGSPGFSSPGALPQRTRFSSVVNEEEWLVRSLRQVDRDEVRGLARGAEREPPILEEPGELGRPEDHRVPILRRLPSSTVRFQGSPTLGVGESSATSWILIRGQVMPLTR